MKTLDVLFTPADFDVLQRSALEGKVCVVFDVLRATSTMVTALHHGAAGIIPAATIEEALRLHDAHQDWLLAGEREGVRIRKDLTGSIDFDLGNSPREFMAPEIRGKSIIMTTTNGTRALRACRGADATIVCCFLNLRATAERLVRLDPQDLVLVCSGTREETAYEDVLCAGGMVDSLWPHINAENAADSALMGRRLFQIEHDLGRAFAQSRNGRRLLAIPDLQPDVDFCTRRDCFDLVAGMTQDGVVTAF
jgi:2-phosphosulfolactate phosphatase